MNDLSNLFHQKNTYLKINKYFALIKLATFCYYHVQQRKKTTLFQFKLYKQNLSSQPTSGASVSNKNMGYLLTL